ncbi:hypothetical protein COOONC_22394 [Cooperia oncophora]
MVESSIDSAGGDADSLAGGKETDFNENDGDSLTGDRKADSARGDGDSLAEENGSSKSIGIEETSDKRNLNEEEAGELSSSELPTLNHISIPSIVALTGSGKVIANPDLTSSVQSSGESGVTIFLSSNFSTSESDSIPQVRPIFINVPHPQPLPLNVTITRRTVRKYRKTHREPTEPHKVKSQTTTVATTSTRAHTQGMWKVKMVPKTSPKPKIEKIPEWSDDGEPSIKTTTVEPKTKPAFVPSEAESFDQPLVEKSPLVREDFAPVETTTEWQYVTAPGERTASPEVLAAIAAQNALLVSENNFPVENEPEPIEVRRAPARVDTLAKLNDPELEQEISQKQSGE